MPDIDFTKGVAIFMTTTTIKHLPTGNTDSMDDLLLGISNGDPTAWNEIIRRYGSKYSEVLCLWACGFAA
jgi:hypothetical protein